MAVRYPAEAVQSHQGRPPGGWGQPAACQLLFGTTPDATGLRADPGLGGHHRVLLCQNYLREVTNIKLSMTMVFYIREAVYDKLQHAGFKFHDAISTGELINRSLTDLQNVRAFINSAVLITVEIVLIVGGYFLLLLWRSPLVAMLALVRCRSGRRGTSCGSAGGPNPRSRR